MRYLLLLLLMLPTAVYADLPVAVAEGRVSLYDVFAKQVEFDRVYGGSFVQVEKAHHEIHEGNYFIASDSHTMTAGDTVAWMIRVRPDIAAHMAISFISNQAGYLEIIEQPTVGDSGVALVAYNMNRYQGDTSATLVFDNALLGGGTIIYRQYIGANTPQVRGGGSNRTGIEWILRHGYRYAVRFRSDAANTAANINFEWYEHSEDR